MTTIDERAPATVCFRRGRVDRRVDGRFRPSSNRPGSSGQDATPELFHLVTNRLPVTWVDDVGWRSAPGGLVTALQPLQDGCVGDWIGSAATLGSPPPGAPQPSGVVPDQLRLDDEAGRFVSSLFDAGKPVAVICHGPRTLVEAGRVDGRTLTVGRACERMSRTLAVPGWTRRSSCAPRDPITSCRAAIPDLPVFTSHLVATFADGR